MPTRPAASLMAERNDRRPKPIVSPRVCRISTEEHPPGEERRGDVALVPSRFCQHRFNITPACLEAPACPAHVPRQAGAAGRTQDKPRLCILVVRLNQQKGWKVVMESSMEGNKLHESCESTGSFLVK